MYYYYIVCKYKITQLEKRQTTFVIFFPSVLISILLLLDTYVYKLVLSAKHVIGSVLSIGWKVLLTTSCVTSARTTIIIDMMLTGSC